MTTTQDQYLLPWDKNRQDWEAKHAERMGVIAKEDAKALADKEVLGKNIAAMREKAAQDELKQKATHKEVFQKSHAAATKKHSDHLSKTKAHSIDRANKRKEKEAAAEKEKSKKHEESMKAAKERWASQKVLDGT